ncbi:hypothetical protein IWW38_005346, partial [Coemansia aciculifera]
MVVTGVFNIIINPAYTIFIWHYHDAYGIRNLMCLACAMGVVFWAAVMTWRLNKRWGNIHLSASVVYTVQVVFVYTCYVVIPLISSVRFSAARRRMALNSGQDTEQGSVAFDPDDLFHAGNDTIKREFLNDMQTTGKHQEVKRFAASCFCTELVSFLDVLQAFKNCVYQDMLTSTLQQQSSAHLDNNANSEPRIEIQSIATTTSTQGSNVSAQNWGVQSMFNEPTTHSSESQAAISARTSLVHGHKDFAHALFNRDSIRSALRPKRKHPSRPSKHSTSVYNQANANLQSLTAGITKTMAHAFPEQGINGQTEFSE